MINARAETLTELPSFKHLVDRRRCIIPADGFYEWRKEDRRKVPMWVHLKSREPFGLAGLWDVSRKPGGGKVESFTIITTEPNDLIQLIQNRMPVILQPEDEERWLNASRTVFAKARLLLKPYPVETSQAIGALVLGLIDMGFVGWRAAVRLWHAVHRDKAIKRPVSRRVRERWIHEDLRRIRQMAQDLPQDPKTFYAESGQFMRQYLTEWLDVEARGLTPGEAEQALQAAGCNVETACWPGNGQHQASLIESLEQTIKMTPRAR